MLMQYHGKYYAYKGATKGEVMEDEDVALAIGAFESAFSANVVASYIFEMKELAMLVPDLGQQNCGQNIPTIHNRALGINRVW
eukprot:461211-Ditylum_brightwellii.AAC.2